MITGFNRLKSKLSEFQFERFRRRYRSIAISAISIFVLCLFLAFPIPASCSVQVKPFLRTSERPQVTVSFRGTPQPGARIEVYKLNRYPQKDEKLGFRLTTDVRGLASLPKLAPGQYRVDALANPDLKASLYLEFIPEDPNQTDHVSMELLSNPPYTREPILAAAEKSSISNQFSEFRGVVRDQAGGLIPAVSIDVVQLRRVGRPTIRLNSDSQGRFSANLIDGDYVAFFSLSGFKEFIIPLTISKSRSRFQRQKAIGNFKSS